MNINGQELTPLQEQLFILRGMGLGEIADDIYAAFLVGAEHARAAERERIASAAKLKAYHSVDLCTSDFSQRRQAPAILWENLAPIINAPEAESK